MMNGYKEFKSIFCINNDGGFNIHSLISTFSNLQSFVIFNCKRPDKGYINSINLDMRFETDLYQTIKIVKSKSSLIKSFKHIVIVNPFPSISIDQFINKQQNKLSELGWKAMKKTYNDVVWGECPDSLFAHPL